MGKAEDIINSVLSDRKLEKERVYRDEPLIFTASQMKSYTPPEYAEMQRIASSKKGMFMSSAELFYRQGKLMEDFSESFDRPVSCTRHFPTYRDITIPQLRSYFSWRTAVRREEGGAIKGQPQFPMLLFISMSLLILSGFPRPRRVF